MNKLLSALAMVAMMATSSAFAEDKPAAPKDAAAQADVQKDDKGHKKEHKHHKKDHKHHKKEHKNVDPAAKAARKEKLKKCTAEANAKGLHGKARKDYRKTCLKAA